jgi:hypothetical protein
MKLFADGAKSRKEISLSIFNALFPGGLYLLGLPAGLQDLVRWFPYEPIYTVVMHLIAFVSISCIYVYLYRNKKEIGKLKTTFLIVMAIVIIYALNIGWAIFGHQIT